MSRVRKCKCGWKLPTYVASVELPEGCDEEAVWAVLKTCKLQTLIICPRCGAQYGRKEAFGDREVIESELAAHLSRGGPPS